MLLKPPNTSNPNPRRKTLIATRLKQHHQNLLQQQAAAAASVSLVQSTVTKFTSNEMQFVHDRDSFKCSLCYPDGEICPSTSVSTLNKMPSNSQAGASNFSFDKEQVLKHVLIVHLSFLAYKCDACVQFYAFDEPQTKQHAALVHQCGAESKSISCNNNNNGETLSPVTPTNSTITSPNATCHFKLIKTEEEINLAINRAQQFITKIQAASPHTIAKMRQALTQSNVCLTTSNAVVTPASSSSSTTATTNR